MSKVVKGFVIVVIGFTILCIISMIVFGSQIPSSTVKETTNAEITHIVTTATTTVSMETEPISSNQDKLFIITTNENQITINELMSECIGYLEENDIPKSKELINKISNEAKNDYLSVNGLIVSDSLTKSKEYYLNGYSALVDSMEMMDQSLTDYDEEKIGIATQKLGEATTYFKLAKEEKDSNHPAPMYSIGDVVSDEPDENFMAHVIYDYYPSTDEYLVDAIFCNRDDSWGHLKTDNPDKWSRTEFESNFPYQITHISVNNIPIEDPTLS